MQVKLTEGDQARLRYATTSNVAAWTHWVQGLAYYRQAVTEESTAAVLACWKRALALDPDSAALNAMIGLKHWSDARFGWWDDRETALAKARSHAEKALALDPENADGHITMIVVQMTGLNFGEAVAHARRAVRLAPGSADAATFACFVLACGGFPDEAVVQGERAMALSPNYPAYYLGILGNAYRLAGRFDDAIDAFKAFNAREPGFGLTDLVIAYQQIDQWKEARNAAEQLLSIRRNFTITDWASTQFRVDSARLNADIAVLRAAGLTMNGVLCSSARRRTDCATGRFRH